MGLKAHILKNIKDQKNGRMARLIAKNEAINWLDNEAVIIEQSKNILAKHGYGQRRINNFLNNYNSNN